MKTFALRSTLMLAACLLLSAAQAAGPGSPLTASTVNSSRLLRQVEHQIDRHGIYPLDDDGQLYGQVDVAFVVNMEGRIVVLSAVSANAELREYVLEKLGRVHVAENPSGIWQTTHVRFIFKPEAH